MKAADERFAANVFRAPSGCHEWIGRYAGTGSSYPQFTVDGVHWQAHRYAYTQHRGPIPAGLFVLHSCHNSRCVNPKHLRLGTQLENMADRKLAGRYTRPYQGRRLSPQDVVEIHRARARGATIKRIAGWLCVSPRTVLNALSGSTWADLLPANDNDLGSERVA